MSSFRVPAIFLSRALVGALVGVGFSWAFVTPVRWDYVLTGAGIGAVALPLFMFLRRR